MNMKAQLSSENKDDPEPNKSPSNSPRVYNTRLYNCICRLHILMN